MVHGVGGMTMEVNTKPYSLKMMVKTSRSATKAHELVCYSLDEIAKVHKKQRRTAQEIISRH